VGIEGRPVDERLMFAEDVEAGGLMGGAQPLHDPAPELARRR
jgi:hypothetical protein